MNSSSGDTQLWLHYATEPTAMMKQFAINQIAAGLFQSQGLYKSPPQQGFSVAVFTAEC